MAGRYDPLTRTAIRGGRTTVPAPAPTEAPPPAPGTDAADLAATTPGTGLTTAPPAPGAAAAPGPCTVQAPGAAPAPGTDAADLAATTPGTGLSTAPGAAPAPGLGTAPAPGTGTGPGPAPRTGPRTPRTRTWTPPGPLDLGLTLGPLRRGPADPTFRATAGAVWRAGRTPDGPATLRVTRDGSGVIATAWGPGAAWILDGLPELLGGSDDPAAFVPRHRLLHASHRRRPGLRLTRTGLVLETLIPTILEQKVTTDEAYRAWRRLVRQYGEPAPGPAPDPTPGASTGTGRGTGRGTGAAQPLYVMPDPRTWTLIPSWDWHKAGVDAKRSATIVRAARLAARLEEAAAMDLPEATARLEAIPGIGPWTSSETLQRSNGAADAVTTGDLHLPGIIGYALAGDRDADDAAMLELLAPYAGQRHRAARLVLLAGAAPPRRSPRMPRGDIGRL